MGLNIGVLTSVGQTVDAFFPPLIGTWRSQGHDVRVAAGSPAQLVETTVITGLTRKAGPRLARAPKALRAWVSDNKIDVVLTSTATASAIARTSRLGVPVVYFCHGLHWDRPSLTNLHFRLIEKVLLRRTDGIVTLNSADTDWFAANGRGIPTIRLPFGVGLEAEAYPRSKAPIEGGRARLVWIGEFSARKAPMEAVELASALRDLGVDFSLTMVGEGAERDRVVRSLQDRSLGDRVSAPGRQSASKVLAEASAIVHTAHWEGLPRVLLEAVSVGRPIYAFDAKGVRDIPGAVLVDRRDARELAHLIARDIGRPGSLSDRVAAYPEPHALSSDVSAGLLAEFLLRHFERPLQPR